jgi:hypothetical protein
VATFNNRFEGDNYGQINQAGGDVNVTNVGSSLDALLATDALRAELGRLTSPRRPGGPRKASWTRSSASCGGPSRTARKSPAGSRA